MRLNLLPGNTARRSTARRSTARNGTARLWMWKVVGAIGFEPTTYGSQNRRATKLRYAPNALVLTGPDGFGKGDCEVAEH